MDLLLLDAASTWRWHLLLVGLIASIGSAIIFTTHKRKSDPLKHLPRYEVVKGGKLSNQFDTAEELMRYGYTKVSTLRERHDWRCMMGIE